jgi:putative endonuclease
MLTRLVRMLRQRASPLTLHLATGRRGERVAAAHLRRAGYRLLGRNLRQHHGEIDLLAQAPDGRTIVIIEVKARVIEEGGLGPRPEVHVNRAKQRKLVALAATELRRRGLTDRPARFDVIGVDLPRHGPAVIRHHVGAFASHV